ncbi:molybdopterin-guanine dinucleotide biosynthesis protein B [gamma proteobacterium HTCC5015]|nr:molybdopterin-guanine dinucleotide biosynthesis protein B [gamma proteobacterium HTCC5015]
MFDDFPLPVIGLIADKSIDKSAFIKVHLPLFNERGWRVGVIKEVHDRFDVDQPGTASFEMRKAGATQMLLTSGQRWALMYERECHQPPKLEEHLAHLELDELDLVLVETLGDGRFPKIELHKPAIGKPLLFPQDDAIVAVATDSPLILPDHIHQLDLNQPLDMVQYIECHYLSSSR